MFEPADHAIDSGLPQSRVPDGESERLGMSAYQLSHGAARARDRATIETNDRLDLGRREDAPAHDPTLLAERVPAEPPELGFEVHPHARDISRAPLELIGSHGSYASERLRRVRACSMTEAPLVNVFKSGRGSMRLFVLGATGETGSEIVDLCAGPADRKDDHGNPAAFVASADDPPLRGRVGLSP
jgi:hypothetical protein